MRPCKKQFFLPVLLIVFIQLSIFLSGCQHHSLKDQKNKNDALKGTITISGAFALSPLIADLAYTFQNENPQIKINVIPGSTGRSESDIAFHLTDLGLVSKKIIPDSYGFWNISIAKDAVVPVINSNHPCLETFKKTGINKKTLFEIFSGNTIKYWDELPGIELSKVINLYVRSDACGASDIWASFLGCDMHELHGTGVYGDPGMINAITNSQYGLGYANLRYVFDVETRKKINGIEILSIDINNNGLIDQSEKIFDSLDTIIEAIKTGLFPAPPARTLYIIAESKPTDSVNLSFLRWLLTKGQMYIESNGFVPLDAKVIETELQKL